MCRPQSQTARRGGFKDLKVRGTEELGKNVQYSAELIFVQCTLQYIILKNGILKLISSILPSNKGYISQYTPLGVYGINVNEIK